MLLVSSHGIVRDAIRSLLETRSECRVVAVVAHAHDALKEAQRLTPGIAVMDMEMPGVGGIDAIRTLAREAPALRLVVLSMHSSPEAARLALDAGARAYVCKKSASDELVKAIRAVASGRTYVCKGLRDYVRTPRRGGSPAAWTVERLTSTESEILRLVADGKSSSEVAQLLRLSRRTVETYRQRLMRKLDIENLPSLVKFAIRNGIISLD